MQDLTFGIEIETIKQTRQTVAKAIQSVVGGTVQHEGLGYDAWTVKDAKGRTWKVVMDASLNADREHQAEIVSPILKAEDIARANRWIRSLQGENCAIHSCLPVKKGLEEIFVERVGGPDASGTGR